LTNFNGVTNIRIEKLHKKSAYNKVTGQIDLCSTDTDTSIYHIIIKKVKWTMLQFWSVGGVLISLSDAVSL